MARLVMVVQLLDPDDPVLGYVAGPIAALTSHFDEVVVVANEVRAVGDLGIRTISLGKESGRRRWGRGLAYQAALLSLARSRRDDTVVLAHMCPEYLNLALPVARVMGIPTMLWFSHPRDSMQLALAEWGASAVLTALPGSFPRTSTKVHVIGQTVDTTLFRPSDPRPPAEHFDLVAVGRVSPVKNLDVVIRALAEVRAGGIDARLRIVGPSVGESAERCRADLIDLAGKLGVGSVVSMEAPVPHHLIPELLAGSDALVNATTGGSADKVVFEAMASGRPVVASNPALAEALSASPINLRFGPGDHAAMARVIADLARADSTTRRLVAGAMRAEAETNHSCGHWAAGVAEVAASLLTPAP